MPGYLLDIAKIYKSVSNKIEPLTGGHGSSYRPVGCIISKPVQCLE